MRTSRDHADGLVHAAGDMAARIRAHDWAATPLGPIRDWPPALKTAVEIMLNAPTPVSVNWGGDLLLLYNDAFAGLIGNKHPGALGQPARRILPEIWEAIGALFAGTLNGAGPAQAEDRHLPLERSGRMEDAWFSFSLTPIPRQDGTVGGIFNITTETTARVREQQRARFLSQLSESLHRLSNPVAVMEVAAEMLGRHLSVDQVAYAEIDDAADFGIIHRDWNAGTMPSNAGRHRLSDFGSYMEDLRRGETVVIADVAEDPRTAAAASLATFASVSTHAFINVPLIKDGRLTALLNLHCAAPRRWSAQDVALAEDTAQRTWAAVERAQAEQALRLSEMRLREAAEAARFGLFHADYLAGTVYWSPEMRAIIGYPQDAPTPAPSEVPDFVHPEDLADVQEMFAQVLDPAGDGQVFHQHRIIRPDGDICWVQMNGQVDFVDTDQGRRPAQVRGMIQDITEHKRNEDRQAVLIAELDHRVKNVLAVVLAIARQSLGKQSEAARSFIGRLTALAESHVLLARSRWDGASLRDLVTAAVAPYRAAPAEGIEIDGPDLMVNPKAAQTLALALHELATNAAKYGALSSPAGRITARWQHHAEGKLVFNWADRAGPALAAPPGPHGFGSKLIDQVLRYDLGGTVMLDFAPTGLTARFDLPLAKIAAHASSSGLG